MQAPRFLNAAILIPVFNEGERFESLFSRLASFFESRGGETGFSEAHIVVIDDGSNLPVKIPESDRPTPFTLKTHLLRHPVNLGQGAALQTGLAYARDYLGCDFFATLDADGQHDPFELPRFIEKIKGERLSFVFGNRWNPTTEATIPTLRKLVLKFAIGFERLVTGIQLHDSHNGFRAFDQRAASLIELKQNKMAYATELTHQIAKHGIPYGEVPVTIVYSKESLAKGQKNLDGFVIIKDLVRNLIFDA